MTQLSQLVDVQSIQADGTSLTLTTSGGAALVVGTQSFNLTTQTDPTSGFQDVFSQVRDITSSITGGNLAGDIQLRDKEIPSLQSSLDTLASGIANSVNTQNAAGFDLNGHAGGNIFVPPTGVAGSAINLAVAISDPNLIAASADGTAGNNANATALANLQSQTLSPGKIPSTTIPESSSKWATTLPTLQPDFPANSCLFSSCRISKVPSPAFRSIKKARISSNFRTHTRLLRGSRASSLRCFKQPST
jgi:flagellar hook-associated protein 1 FlgK